jgi:replicative DNA helicase
MNTDPQVTLMTSLFCWPDGVAEVAPIVHPEDLIDEDCRHVYRAFLALSQRGVPIDSISVVGELRSNGMSDDNAVELVDRATDGCPIRGQAKRYAQLIQDAAKKRSVRIVMDEAHVRAEQGEDPEEIMRDVLAASWELDNKRQSSEIQPVSEFALQVMNEVAGQRNGDITQLGIQTGITALDIATRGICASELWVIGAMPGRGKTALGTQIAFAACTAGLPVLFVSLEMTIGQLFRRLLAAEVGANYVRNPRALSAEGWNDLTEYAGELAGLPLYIEDSSSLSATDLSLRCRLCIRRHGVRLIVVDYLQLIRGSGKELRERVSDAANMLRQLAKDTGVPIVALSQLRRPGNLNDVPTMIELKESGDIEAHAHTVILIHMPQDEETRAPNGEDELIIGKQRNGSIGTVPVVFDRKSLVFRERILVR